MANSSSNVHVGNIPQFLHLYDSSQIIDGRKPYYEATLKHSVLGVDAFTLWWPPTKPTSSPSPDIIVLFLPGNPGLLGFYSTFLSELYHKANKDDISFAILAHAHLGHTPGLTPPGPGRSSLPAQVDAAMDALDIITTHFGTKTKYVVIGHSVGSWMTVQLLKYRPKLISRAFLLFPTISQLAKTPNGLKVSWGVRGPFPWIVSQLSRLAHLIPASVIKNLFHDWPPEQLAVLRSLITSPSVVYSALVMAKDEMNMMKELDIETLTLHQEKLYFYYAQRDDWVGTQREVVLSSLPDVTANTFHGPADIPHAFCINHGSAVAHQCYTWLKNSY